MPKMTTFEKHQLIDTLSKLINILRIKTININTVLLNEQSPFALNHDFGNQLIFMGNLIREIALIAVSRPYLRIKYMIECYFPGLKN